MAEVTMRNWRGDRSDGTFVDYAVATAEGEVLLDVVHHIQAGPALDLACRWNCKAGKCGSCSAEINCLPRLMCMPRIDELPGGEPVVVAPMRTFPIIRDLVTDVSFNYRMSRRPPPFAPRPPGPDGTYRMMQIDVERGQEFRKCIECFLCQDVCQSSAITRRTRLPTSDSGCSCATWSSNRIRSTPTTGASPSGRSVTGGDRSFRRRSCRIVPLGRRERASPPNPTRPIDRPGTMTGTVIPSQSRTEDASMRWRSAWTRRAGLRVGLGGAANCGHQSERSNAINRREQLRRRRVTLGALLFASGTSVILLVIAPSVGALLTTLSGLGVVVDVVLLIRRQQHVEEWAMTAAFRRVGRTPSSARSRSRP